jgi:hypothetical protein
MSADSRPWLPHSLASMSGTAIPAAATPKAASPGTGPAAFLAAHPLAYGLSLVGSGAAAVCGLTIARHKARYRVLWLAIGAHCAAQFAGIAIATEVARRRALNAQHPPTGGD